MHSSPDWDYCCNNPDDNFPPGSNYVNGEISVTIGLSHAPDLSSSALYFSASFFCSSL